jgi:hypothetical protein
MNTQYMKPLLIYAAAWPALLYSLTGHAVSLEFFGLSSADEGDYVGRVRIPLDDPEIDDDPGPAVDVGAGDFTIEFWMRTTEPGPSIGSCSSNNWISARIIIDRDRYEQARAYGIAITDGVIAFGVDSNEGSETVCGDTDVADDEWHHVAVQRRYSDGRLYIFVDGGLDAEEDGPGGDISYPDNGYPNDRCVINGMSSQPCLESDPYIVIGAEKHDVDVDSYPPFIGRIDEIRFSDTLRYATGYTVPTSGFAVDGSTVALYPLEEGTAGSSCLTGNQIFDTAGGDDGHCRFGGNSSGGPRWSADTPFSPLPPGSSSSSSSSTSSSTSSSSSSGGTGSSTSSSSSSSGGGDGGGGGGAFHIGLIALLLAAAYRRR